MGKIDTQIVNLNAKVEDNELKALCTKFLKNTSEKGKSNAENVLRELENFVSGLPKEEINKGNLPAISEEFDKKLFFGPESDAPDLKGHRLSVSKDPEDSKYSVRIEDRVYPAKPKADSKYVPYSENGEDWVRLDIASLSKRLGVSRKEIQKTVKDDVDGAKLRQLIQDHLRIRKYSRALDDFLRDEPLGKGEFDFLETVTKFSRELAKAGFYYYKDNENKESAIMHPDFPAADLKYLKSYFEKAIEKKRLANGEIKRPTLEELVKTIKDLFTSETY